MNEKRMSLGEHLAELRSRVLVCVMATVLATALAYCFCADVFFPLIRAPLDAIQGDEAQNPFVLKTPLLRLLAKERPRPEPGLPPNQLYYHSLVVPILVQFKVSLVVGIILALPVLVYQVWAFVSAGLYPKERRYVRIYGPVSFVLFLVGVAVAYFVILPVSVVFLIGQGEAMGLRPILSVDRYMSLILWLLLGFGIVFEMPLVLLFLAKIGVVTPRGLAKGRRFAILAIVIVAACITPTSDPFTLMAMAIPMIGLYELSILLARVTARKREAEG